MFSRVNTFLKTSTLGGLLVILPLAISYLVFRWIFNLVTGMIQPLTNLILKAFSLPEIFADIFVILVILLACFFIGIFVKTKLGGWAFHNLEDRVLRSIPGYRVIKETVLQFSGTKKSPFSRVAISQIFGNEIKVSSFITDEHADGSYTVFVPTGPNPTTGFIFHLPAKFVHPIEVPIEDVMRSIISCGVGSHRVLKRYHPV